MDDADAGTNPVLKWLGRITIAVAVAYLSSASVAAAAGLGDHSDDRTAAGIIVGCVTLTALVFLETQLRKLFTTLAWTNRRPHIAVVIALIAAGVLCVIAAVCLQVIGGVDSASFDRSSGGGSAQVSLRGRPSIMITITTVAVLMIAAMLIGLGVWGSIPPAEHRDEDLIASKVPSAKSEPPPKP